MGDNREIVECNSSSCQYHALTESVVGDLKIAVQRLMEGQDQMKETVIQLAEAFKAMERIDNRMEKLEDLRIQKDKEQDAKIDDLRIFMYKAIGGLLALSSALAVVLKFAGLLMI